jgi:t-SNARE complex subunit (syntaxin)
MDTALKVQDEMSKMVVNQGEQLNEAENNIDTAQKNVKDAEEHLI